VVAERCECGAPTVCQTPQNLKAYIEFMKRHPSRSRYQSPASRAGDARARQRKGRR